MIRVMEKNLISTIAELREVLDCEKNPGMIGEPMEVVLEAKAKIELLEEDLRDALSSTMIQNLNWKISQLEKERDELRAVADENYWSLIEYFQELLKYGGEINREELLAHLESRVVHKPQSGLRAKLERVKEAIDSDYNSILEFRQLLKAAIEGGS
jgi:hypothetical protein